MIQTQLVDYISSQLKVGISREAIKASLIGAGWQAADVEDTLKKVEGAGSTLSGAATVASIPTTKTVSAFPSSGPKITDTGTKAGDPQMIRMNDLIAGSGPTPVTASKPATMSNIGSPAANPAKITTTTKTIAEYPAEKPKSGHGMVWTVIVVVVMLALAGAAGFFYMQNSGLMGQVAALNTQSASVTAQLATLQQQAAASSTGLAASAQALSAESKELSLELSFYAAPPNAPTSTAASLTGTLSGGGKSLYAVTTVYGAKIFIANSRDVRVDAALKPLVGSSVQLSGTYVPGSDSITIMNLNGAPIAAPAAPTPAAASTTTSTSASSSAGSTAGH